MLDSPERAATGQRSLVALGCCSGSEAAAGGETAARDGAAGARATAAGVRPRPPKPALLGRLDRQPVHRYEAP